MGSINLALRTRLIDGKGHRFEKNIILTCVRRYLAYLLSDRHLATGKNCPLQHRAMPWLPKKLDEMTVLRRKEINATQLYLLLKALEPSKFINSSGV